MRVVAGSARGHKLISVSSDDIRPTLDKVKEAVFSSLSEDIYGSRFLDLFSGSGGVGIEALSRGADFVAFVEQNKTHADIIKQNIAHVKKAITHGEYDVYWDDAFSVIKKLHDRNENFDLIFLDPPYGNFLVDKTLEALRGTTLANNALIIAEISSCEEIGSFDWIDIIKLRKYGKVKIYYIKIID